MGMFKSLVTEICELYGQGMDAVRIARILNMPVQDVGYVIETYYEEFAE
jgi:hypothetical protein